MTWMPVLPEADAPTPVPTQTLLVPLTHLTVIEAAGADATAFLHAQLSNDVQGLAPGDSLLAGYCNAKGRLFALPRLWRSGDHWRLCLPADIADTVLRRLRMFVLRSQVMLARREDLTLFGVAGPGADDCLRQASLPLPARIDAVLTRRETTVLRGPAMADRFLICLPDDAAPACWDALATCARPAHATCWRLLDIDVGLPAVYAPTLEAFVPQMVNLELIAGVSFKKGCYPGQEIVARMHYLGKPSRRTYRFRAAADPPPPGAAVLSDDSRDVGTVIDAQRASDGECRLLAVLQVAAAEQPLRLADSARLERLALPYTVDTEATADR